MKLIILFILTCVSSFAQHGDIDTVKHKTANTEKKSYKKYKKTTCNYNHFSDNDEAKEVFCKANYYYTINDYHSSIDCLKQAYVKGVSAEFKFQILKLMVDNYKQLGDNKQAEVYQEKVNKVLEKFPNFAK